MKKYISLTLSVEKQGHDVTDEDIKSIIANANEMLKGNKFCGFNIQIYTYANGITVQYNGGNKPLDCIGGTGSHYDYQKSPLAPYGW